MRWKQALWILALGAAGIAALIGCSTHEDEGTDYIDKWKEIAEQTQGHSPPAEPPPTDMSQFLIDEPEIISVPEEELPQLPTMGVTLRMHDADLVAVLQALSRAAGQSLVISPDVEGTININIRNMPWNQVFQGILASNGLTYAWVGNIIRIMSMEDMQQDLDMDILRKKHLSERLDLARIEPLSTALVRVRYSNAENLQPRLVSFLSKDAEGQQLGQIEVDAHTNSLIIAAIPADIERLVRIINRLDAPRPQIRLKAHIVETTEDTARALGTQWGGSFSGRVRNGYNMWAGGGGYGGTAGTDPQANTGVTPTLNGEETGISGQNMITSFIPSTAMTSDGQGSALSLLFGRVGGNMLEIQLQALEEESKLNIISSPSITTMDNQTAYTESGERVPYQTVDSNGNISVEYQDAVLRLEITPHIIDEEFIRLEVTIKKDEVDDSRAVSGNPYIVSKETQTTLICRTGETVVISGLSRHRRGSDDMGIPGLRDIPGLGYAFGGESRTDLMDEFLIFITPEMLSRWQAGEQARSLDEIEAEVDRRMAEEREAARRAAEEGEDEAADAVELSNDDL